MHSWNEAGFSLGFLLTEAILMAEPKFDCIVMLFYYTTRVLTNQHDVL
jgi:hypothetical protein